MSSLTLAPPESDRAKASTLFDAAAGEKSPAGVLALLTLIVLLAHGYHPLAEDGALYVAGIEKLLHPGLYRPDAVFVASHARVSAFGHLVAWLYRITLFPLPILLLALHLLSIFLFLLGVWRVAAKISSTAGARWGALLLGACCFTLPVAGTSLFLMDPYVTARSFSTPFGLFALAALLDDAWLEAAVWVLLAAAMDFLMAGYLAIFLVTLVLARHRMWRGMAAFIGSGLLVCAALFWATRHPEINLPASQAALSRSYFFLSTWQWYEYPGLILPLLLFLIAAWRTRARGAAGELSIAALVTGSCASLVSLCLVHRTGSLLLAKLQVLRVFHPIYLVGLVLIGGLMGRHAAGRVWAAAIVYLGILLAMFAGQRLTYPASNHIEWPGMAPRNPWQQAFLWIRSNTPKDAVFALDAGYILDRGEDAQGFRATAGRSALADWVKDGGIACISHAAQAPWWRQVQATRNLDSSGDAARVARLAPLGATWIVLPARAGTAFRCPYDNGKVKVCRLGIR